MPILVQVCIVIATASVVALTVATLITLRRMSTEVGRVVAAAQLTAVQLEAVARETRELLVTVQGIVQPAASLWQRARALGERVGGITAAVLDDIEPPLLTSVALLRGVQAGASRLMAAWQRRTASTPNSNHGEHSHDRSPQ